MPDPTQGLTSLAPGSSYRTSQTGESDGTRRISVYPNPFFDLAQAYLPKTVKDLFRWCRYYAITNPLIGTVIHKMSAYPITELVYEGLNPGVQLQWQELFEDRLRIRPFLIEANLDKQCYGNSFVSVGFPFRKYLTCKGCGARKPIERVKKWRLRNYTFHIECECGYNGEATAKDQYTKSLSGIRLIRWNPERISIRYNEATGERTYFYDIPPSVRNDVTNSHAPVVERVPQIFIEAIKHKKSIILKNDHVFHASRPSVSGNSGGWGTPLLFRVLKDVFYLQLLKRAQEAIFLGYTTPMRIFYPAPQSASGDPFQMMNLGNWKDRIGKEIGRHRRDPLYIPVFPIPVGYQNVGGEGKALMLSQEIRVWSEHIISGMGVPPELLFSGVSWSGSNVSLRMLENEFLGDRKDNLALVRFIMRQIAAHLGWLKITLRFKPFKMADDLQRAAFDLQLAQQKKLSFQTLLEGRDYDFNQEQDRVKKELPNELELGRKQQEYQAETAGRSQVTQTQYQVKAQQLLAAAQPQQPEMGQEGGQPAQQGGEQAPQQGGEAPARPSVGGDDAIVRMSSPLNAQSVPLQVSSDGGLHGGNMDMQAVAARIASQISGAPREQQGLMLSSLKVKDPNLYALALQYLNRPQAAKPLPEHLPPRRGPGTAQI